MIEKTLEKGEKSSPFLKRKYLVIMIAFVILCQLVFFSPFSWSTPPGKTIRIGVIAPFDEYVWYDDILFKQILEPEINAYVAKLPYDRFRPRTSVEFIIESASWDPNIHLDKVKKFHNDGVDMIIGGHYTYLAEGSLEYINDNDILMITPSATGSNLAIEDDNLFRLAPDSMGQGKVIAAMLDSKGITKIVNIQRDDSWADGLFEAVSEHFTGTVLAKVVYPIDSLDTIDYSPYMSEANEWLTGSSDEGVLLLSLDEAGILLAATVDYTELSSVEWFGSDGTADSSHILVEAPDQAVNVKLYSPITTFSTETATSSRHLYMKSMHETMTGYPFGFYAANEMDAGWLLALGVLDTQSKVKSMIPGDEVAMVLTDLASMYYGYSGLCELDAAGDRVPGNYAIWGYGMVDGIPNYVVYGMYNTASDTLTWNP